MTRQQLPPQIKKVQLKKRENGKPAIRYQLCVDVGFVNGKRKQHKERFELLDDALAMLAKLTDQRISGTYVHPEKTTVTQACEAWLDSKHSLKPSTIRGHRQKLDAVMDELGDLEVQKLTKNDLDKLVGKLRKGTAKNRRRAWSARSVNYMLCIITAVLADRMKQGLLVRNVGALVDRLPSEQKEMKTLTEEQMYKVFDHECRDQHLWVLGLHGLRRGEIAGLRWEDIDFELGTITIINTRVTLGKETITSTPKSEKSRRTLPMPDDVRRVLKVAEARQTAERVLAGSKYESSGYVACDGLGKAYSPNLITFRWGRMLDTLGIPRIRLHDSRHTCGTLMHLRGVPVAVISDWLGHASRAFTMNTYVHSQDAALVTAANTFRRDVTSCDNEPAEVLALAS